MNDALIAAERDAAGVVLRYRAGEGVKAQLLRLAELENDCCAEGGVTFELHDGGGEFALHVSAPRGNHDSAPVQTIFRTFLEMAG